ncbi:nucleotidyltransferase family protein [Taibaiella soli]|uniref:D-mannose-1-phosphate guanyltransferase n=1 Tax=Taibaiella soli TaxID=1649169 RepID=A0A2W2AHY3_9BACT|nr:nucleotidyltransferase family protein [Taibaiella soli]PZF73162.1 D-mannose-1-phosphate guanyltransferase [Taibaiella soli]
MECIVLAGGLGTRLQGVIGAYPKCMAPVNGLPFLHYLFVYLEKQQCNRVILSLGFKHEVITQWLDTQDWPFEIDYVIEVEPLGTGGGIQLALEQAAENDVLVLNGDTMFMVDLAAMLTFHREQKAETTLALKEMHAFDRYGIVHTDDAGQIISFEEKKYMESGLINGGIYTINKMAFFGKELLKRFSFEKQYLELFVAEKQFYGYRSESYFIDIGIPEDYHRAQQDFKTIFED